MSNPQVELHIADHGVITLELDADKAPKTVANFLSYVAKDHYTADRCHPTTSPKSPPTARSTGNSTSTAAPDNGSGSWKSHRGDVCGSGCNSSTTNRGTRIASGSGGRFVVVASRTGVRRRAFVPRTFCMEPHDRQPRLTYSRHTD